MSDPGSRAGLRPGPYLELVRVYLTPTAVADSFAGFLLALRPWYAADFSPSRLVTALCASVLAYWFGMAANDLFDREKDVRGAPSRPLPSGRVSPTGARLLCAALAIGALALGLLLGIPLVTGGLLLVILLYDAGGKKLPVVGSLLMGLCRSGNLLLGAAAAAGTTALADPLLLGAAAILGLYIAGVTSVSRLEEAEFHFPRLLVRALPLCFLPPLLLVLEPTRALNWVNGVLLLALLLHALRATRSETSAGPAPHGATLFVRKALAGIFLVDAGIVITLAPQGAPVAWAAVFLYGLFALAWVWKKNF